MDRCPLTDMSFLSTGVCLKHPIKAIAADVGCHRW
jgi:hypothetical protein